MAGFHRGLGEMGFVDGRNDAYFESRRDQIAALVCAIRRPRP
jgi:hypothetical protein